MRCRSCIYKSKFNGWHERLSIGKEKKKKEMYKKHSAMNRVEEEDKIFKQISITLVQ